MHNKSFPARLKVIVARSAPYAVIFRRGPNDRVCTIGWDLKTDTFSVGQWLKGRIYPHRADLSPDGKYMIYFAADFRRPDKLREFEEQLRFEEFGENPKPDHAAIVSLISENVSTVSIANKLMADKHFGKEIKQRRAVAEKYAKKIVSFSGSANDGAPSWTAISRTPYLKALDLWFNGSAWNGGGLFMDQNHVWLNSTPVHRHRCAGRRSKFNVSEEFPFEEYYGGEDAGVYFPRLLRDGWEMIDDDDHQTVFAKKLTESWTIQKCFAFAPDSGYYETHALTHTDGRATPDAAGWCWADFDRSRKRIIYAQDGKIFALKLGSATPKMLCDSNPLEFEHLYAPY